MVKICQKNYPKENEELYKEHFDMFKFPLRDFQKHAIEAIVEGHSVLICAGTGNGKTLPSEFAINYFVAKGKKVIYTSPIKALSNQKYYDFTRKYPHIKFGILTGDIKANPEADVLIMTAEILQNTLYLNQNNKTESSSIAFDMDFDNELACVIHDEVHSINQDDRGSVWESIFMLLPNHVQNVMLSATLDTPEKFAQWTENMGNRGLSDSEVRKQVYLTMTPQRIVPLVHYSFITCNQGVFKSIGKDEALKKEINDLINKPHVIQTSNGEFNEPHYRKMKKMLDLFEQKQVRISRPHVLNQVCRYMVDNNLLPCACFILSRKQIEVAAREITIPLLEDDSKVGYIVKRECEQLLRSKLPNFQEYMELPEYVQMVSLLEKGIATHHSGTMPILKEIVELLFAKGYIKLLFCTETFSCGLNMPIKTVIFTDINKFDGTDFRVLYGYEYVQAAGRAGRQGLDTLGSVIHLNNLFKNTDLTDYKNMMRGTPQKLVSKFKISYNLLLNLIDSGVTDFLEFCQNSMIQDDIDAELGVMTRTIDTMEKEVEVIKNSMSLLKTPRDILEKYVDNENKRATSVNKRRKEIDKEISEAKDAYKTIDADKMTFLRYMDKCSELSKIRTRYTNTDLYLNENIMVILDLLEKEGYVEYMMDDAFINSTIVDEEMKEEPVSSPKYILSPKGQIATCLRESHCLVFAELLAKAQFDLLTAKQMISIFSCFTNISVPDELKIFNTNNCSDVAVKRIIEEIKSKYDHYRDFEIKNYANTGVNYEIHFDLVQYVLSWCDCETAPECKMILQQMELEKNIFLGEFVKAILKINNISSEMEKIAENSGNIALLSKLKEIPLLTMKFVATNQSLYI